jgi:hypothetical protein
MSPLYRLVPAIIQNTRYANYYVTIEKAINEIQAVVFPFDSRRLTPSKIQTNRSLVSHELRLLTFLRKSTLWLRHYERVMDV